MSAEDAAENLEYQWNKILNFERSRDNSGLIDVVESNSPRLLSLNSLRCLNIMSALQLKNFSLKMGLYTKRTIYYWKKIHSDFFKAKEQFSIAKVLISPK